MRFLAEFRDPEAVRRQLDHLAAIVTRPWTVMEVCGGQTHAFVRFGIEQLLPPPLTLLHGPGCPVCVTPVRVLDHALEIAQTDGVTLCSFGDMLRVPGTDLDLRGARARGADVRVVQGALDALALAQASPDRQVVFLGVGFETTAPGVALAVREAQRRGVRNFSVLLSHVRVPPALEALLAEPDHAIDGFLAAGHVCTVMGLGEYPAIAERHRVPIVVAGFEPVDLLAGLIALVEHLEAGRVGVTNAYRRVARDEGSLAAQALLAEVFEPADQEWRGLGELPASGWRLRPQLAGFDAAARFPRRGGASRENADCRAGDVLRGRLKPSACPAFGGACTPDHPLGATMVSSEGACAAYFRYRGVRWENAS